MRRRSDRVAAILRPAARRLAAGLLGISFAVALPAAAQANNLFSIDPDASTVGPIVTEVAGNGYLAWEHKPAGSSEAASTIFCKIPLGDSCTDPLTLPLPGSTSSGEEPVQPYVVLGSQPNIVYVVGPRYTPDDTLIWTSENDGTSFSAARTIDSYASGTGVGDVLLNPLHLASKGSPTSDQFDIASFNPGIFFSEAGNLVTKPLSFAFASPGGFASESTLGFTKAGLPVEAYWTDLTPEEVLYYRNTKAPAYEEKNWTGPTKVAEGYIPRLASGPDGLFMLSQDYLPGESQENAPAVLELRKYKENTGTFEAPVQIARDSSSGLFDQGNLFENPETGALYVVWPEISGEAYVMKLWESTDGGQTFHGERNIAAIGFGYEGPPRLAVAGNGQGWLTFKDEGGLEVADLNPLVFPTTPITVTPTPTPTPTPAPTPLPTTTTTTQSGAGSSGASITVPQGTAVSDQAHIAGSAAASATGTVTYNLYKDSKCTVAATAGSTASVLNGVAGPSAAVKPGPGTYYWKVTYGGNATNDGSTSACGSEVLVVAVNETHLGLPASNACLSKRAFLVHPRAPKGVKLVSVEVLINGKLSKKGPLSGHATTVSLVGLPKGTFKVALITKSSEGKTYEEVRTFHTCVAGKHGQAKK
jgi:hypothetical protein